MDTTQLRQTIQHQIEHLSSDRLQLVVDFLNLLLQAELPQQLPASINSDFRPACGSLLSYTQTWEGSDFEDCLETVIETRSQLQA